MENNYNNKEQTPEISSGTLGTFAGVFTPSILTILGIILFLRMGYVVGNAGLARALIILALANGISVLTTFSLSAIATNLKVKGGGDYYLISRTLGLEFGGAIGIVLFLAQSVSIAFYCIGFGEVLARMLPLQGGNYTQIIAAVAVGFLFIFAWLGTDWATRFQYVVMTILVAALLSFFIGGIAKWNNELLVQNWTAPETGLGFWIIFITLRQRNRPHPKPPQGSFALRRYCFCHHRAGKVKYYCAGGFHVFFDFLRPFKLCHIF